jgi:hypothetical protein
MKRYRLGILCLIVLLGLPSGARVWAVDGSFEPDPWQAMEGPRGGSVAALALSPNFAVDRTVFAGLRAAGVCRSTDGGESWQCSPGDPWAVVDVALSPAYAVDGTVFATRAAEAVGYEVLRSTDEGASWSINTPAWSAPPDPPRLSISPNFASDGTLYVLGGAQTYLSTDGGDTFVQAGGWFTDHYVAELGFSPAYSADRTLFALVPGDGLYKSTDGGTNWDPTALGGDLGTFAVSPNYAADRMLLATSAVDGRLQVSTDGGDSWTAGALALDPGGQHTLVFSPSFNPEDRIIMAASSTDPGPYRSEDGGATWEPADWHVPGDTGSSGFVGGSVYALVLAPAGAWDPAASAGTSAGIYHSYDRGKHWSQSNDGLPRLPVRVLGIAPGAPGTFLAGASLVGEEGANLQLSTDGGQTWHAVSGHLDRVNALAFSPKFPDDETAFATTGALSPYGHASGGIYRSMDGGHNWDEVLGDRVYKGLAISPSFGRDRTLWASAVAGASALGIYASYDGGDVWTSLAPSVHASLIVPSPNYAVDRTLFAGTGDAGLQCSTDAGSSWTQVLDGAVTALAISPAFGASQTLYAATRESPASPCDIQRSTDGGDTWQILDIGIADWVGDAPLTISTLIFASDGTVLAGLYYGDEMQEGGILRSIDGGRTWQRLGFLWHHSNVFTLASLPTRSLTFYAGTENGLWQLPVLQGGPAEPGTWESNGPSGGRADALAVSPDFAADGVALAGTGTMGKRGNAWGLGIFRSSDEGQTWQPTSPDLSSSGSSGAIYSYAFSPDFAVDQTVFAGTWGGLFKSVDGGQSWQWVQSAFFGPPGSITEVAVAPDYASSGHLMGGSPWGGLYVSRDGGRTWAIEAGLGPVWEIAYSPGFGTDATAFAAGAPSGYSYLFRTTDGALSWTPVLDRGICSLAISPEFETDGTLFAGSDALYISHDRGTTWISVTLPVEASPPCPLAISPDFGTDQTLFTATAEGLYRSDDGGLTWDHVTGYTGPPIRSLAISPGWPTHPVLLIGGGDGVYRTADGGDTWSLAPGMVTLFTQPLALAEDQRSLVTGAYQYGIYGSDDAGGSWSPLGLQEAEIGRYHDVAIPPGYPADGTIFAAQSTTELIGASIQRTTDGGAHWEQLLTGQYVYHNALAISPQYTADRTVYAAIGGWIWGSHDGGDTWSMVGEWPSGTYNVARQVALPAQYPTDGTLFAAGNGFWRLPPGATTWEPAASSLIMDAGVNAFAVSPDYARDQTLLATTGRYDPVSGNLYAVLRSADGGVHWELVGRGLPNAPIDYLAFSPRFAIDRTAYLACEGLLYRSLDGGFDWTAVGPAPDAPVLYEMAVDDRGGVYVASGREYGAVGNGVWHYTTPAQDILIDGGFEVDSGWEIPLTEWLAAYSQRVVYDGLWSMRVGVDNKPNAVVAYSSARQEVTIPADAISATLQCYVYPISGEAVQAAQSQVFAPDAAAAGDAQYLLLLDPADNDILDVLFWQLSNAQRWQHRTFDLTPYAGRTLKLHFGVLNDRAGGRTGMYVDDVSLLVQRPAVPWREYQRYLPIILADYVK